MTTIIKISIERYDRLYDCLSDVERNRIADTYAKDIRAAFTAMHIPVNDLVHFVSSVNPKGYMTDVIAITEDI